MNNGTPKISVLMSTHNDARYIEVAVQSVLEQSFTDFELLIMDDGSTDGSNRILERMANDDSRIRLFRNDPNKGLIASLNALIESASGELFARMDGDDLALPERFARQVALLEENPDLAACGTWMRTFGALQKRVIRYPVTDSEIRATMLFQNPFSHPTMMFRRELFDAGLRYRSNAPYAEDYDLYMRLPLDAKLANLPEVHYLYRKHPAQVSTAKSMEQWKTASNVRREYLGKLGIPASDAELDTHASIRLPAPPASRQEVENAEAWLLKLVGLHPEDDAMQAAIGHQWFSIAVRSGSLGWWMWKRFRKSKLFAFCRTTGIQKLEILFLCITRIRYRSWLYRTLEQLSAG